MKTKLIRFNLSMTADMHTKLVAAAAAQGLTLTGYILKRCGFKPLPLGRPMKAGK